RRQLQDLDTLDQLRRELQPELGSLREREIESHESPTCQRSISVLPCRASESTAELAYSIVLPVGTPRASLVTRAPRSRNCSKMASAVPSPSRSGFVARITSRGFVAATRCTSSFKVICFASVPSIGLNLPCRTW